MTHTPPSRTRARRLGSVLAGALALGVIPLASPAWALDPPPARNIGEPPDKSACPVFPGTGGASATTQVPEDGFTDVPINNPHEFAIDCVAWYKVTSGKTATSYDPIGSVQRDQMATFIAQMIDYVADRTASTTDGLKPAGTTNPFPCDLTSSNVHYANIQRLAAAGVVKGSGTNAAGAACYDPRETVSRAQMATFLLEANRVAGLPIPAAASTEDYFVDDGTSPHQGSINAVAKAGLAQGVSKAATGNLYGPNGDVRRDQMGSFIARSLDRLVESNPDGRPPVAGQDVEPNPVKAGGTLTVTSTPVERGTIKSITASGCGSPAVNSTAAKPDEVILAIPANQPVGSCTVTVVVRFTDEPTKFGGTGRSETDLVPVTVEAAV
ncbi:MAG: S-layer homology domain-containing protein, partial [Actinobacteria bacterium]|nr:S-layer homology domain-containing protein [Actinomycetota bacterium]